MGGGCIVDGPRPGETWKEYVQRQTEAYGPREIDGQLCLCNRYAGRHFVGCPLYEEDDEQ